MGVMFVFLGLQMTKGSSAAGGGGEDGSLRWWGNSVHTQTVDWKRSALIPIPEGGLPWAELRPTAAARP
jgi:hypothetical protein